MKKIITLMGVLLASSVCLQAKPLYKHVDISAVANASSQEGDMSIKNFKFSDKPVYLGPVKFNVIDTKKNNGKNIIRFKGGKNQKILIKLPNEKIKYRNMYIIHTTSGDKTYGNIGNGNVATMQIRGGKSVQVYYPKNFDIAGSFFKDDFLGNAKRIFSDDKNAKKGNLYISVFPINSMYDPFEVIEINSYGIVDWDIYAITFSDKLESVGKSFKFDPNEWKPVESKHEVLEGSALDMTNLMTEAPAGKYGRLIVNEKGQFEFEKRPGVRVKFKGTNDRPSAAFTRTIKTHADIDRVVKKYRKQGYNMLRWRLYMNQGNKGLEFEEPYKMKPAVRDLYDYFIFALAREGVYSHWNLSSHDLGDPDFKWSDRIDVKCKFIFGDKKTREDWRKLMHYQLNHVNPYTGKAWKDDMSIATTEYFNELDTLYPFHSCLSREGKDFGNKVFREWIATRYKNVAELNAKWKLKKPIKSFNDLAPFDKREHRNSADVAQFCIHYSRDMQRFCEKVIREEIGFTAPLHQHNCAIRTDVYLLSAEAGTYMANNVYFVHPSAFMSPGSRVPQMSSLLPDNQATYWLHAANKRMYDRPYCVTEYQHSHWNPWKHEAGVFFPAYSAFQNFDNLTIHDQAVSVYNPGPVSCFEVADSPVYRANEFLSCMLFYRGDVSPAKKRVDVVYSKRYVETSHNMTKGMNHEQAKIAFMTGFGIDFPSARKISDLKNVKVKPADMQMEPIGSAREVYGNSTGPAPHEKEQFDINATAKLLKEKGILPQENISNPAECIYQTDTGEITTNFKEGWVKVSTPKTEAVVWKVGMKSTKLGKLNVISSSEPAAIALTSVDNKPLGKSKRMVLVYNTDNTSTGVELSPDKATLKTRGRLPILVKTGKFSVEIELPKRGFFAKLTGDPKYTIYALKMNGERFEEVPFKIENNKMKLDIDTGKLAEPALYYEIVKQ